MISYNDYSNVLAAIALWREARGEPLEGKRAVVFTMLKRAGNPYFRNKDLAGVVSAPWQYSSMTAKGDPNLILWPQAGDAAFIECLQVVDDVINGRVDNPAPGADSYFADSIQSPDWATSDKFVVQIGHHRFYNMSGQ